MSVKVKKILKECERMVQNESCSDRKCVNCYLNTRMKNLLGIDMKELSEAGEIYD